MSCQVRLVLAIHNHQPIGNFDGVFEAAYEDSYQPFLDVLKDYPSIPISLHVSGSLLEWLVEKRPEYIDQIRELVDRGQIEMLGGPFYEPIMACIPRHDRIGQIVAYSHYLKNLFGQQIRGMWVPERVWEQSFASDIAAADIEYTILDDFHFRAAGLTDDQLHGYYLTEDGGRTMMIFPGSERLRYTIPFADPNETIDYLRQIGEQFPHSVVAFGDDGEKFGTWPGTKDHVYTDGWLRRFFDALVENSNWLKVATMAEAIDHVSPVGKIYLPDSSYREMTEWALPTERQIEFQHLKERRQNEPDWEEIKTYLRGGFWRNFRVKYPESNEMYSRMLQVSQRLQNLQDSTVEPAHNEQIKEARTELYRAQCNCSYWHGAFGGLYLPHLRNAVYRHLISADNILESIAGHSPRWVEVEADDYNLDARKEIRLASDRLVAYVAPSYGGHLFELDIRSTRCNLLATLNRRPEPYHELVRQYGGQAHTDEQEGAASIHSAVHFKQPDLDKKLAYDSWPRKSLVDHFLHPGITNEQFQRGEGAAGDFVHGVYESLLRRSDERVELRLRRAGLYGENSVVLTKTIAIDVSNSSALEIRYEMENLPPGMPVHFGVEFNFAGMAAGAPDRYYYGPTGEQLGQLETVQSLESTDRIGLIDEWIGLDAAIELSQPAGIWTFPIQTISQSEGGVELVHQSSTVVPHWEFAAPDDGRWNVKLVLSIDTSAAQARQLRETAVTESTPT